MTDGTRKIVSIEGDGRISYGRSPSRGGAEVRFYRNQTTKTYDAVIPEVLMVISNRVTIREAPKDPEEIRREEEMEKIRAKIEEDRSKDVLKELTEAIVRRDYAEDGVGF